MWKFVGASLLGLVFGAVSNAQIIYEAAPVRYEILPGYNPRLTFEQAARLASVSEQPCVVIVDGEVVIPSPAMPKVTAPYRKMNGLYVRPVYEEPLYFHKRDLLPPDRSVEDRDSDVDRADATRDTEAGAPRVPVRIGPPTRPSDGKMQAGEIRIFPSDAGPPAQRGSDKSDQVTP